MRFTDIYLILDSGCGGFATSRLYRDFFLLLLNDHCPGQCPRPHAPVVHGLGIGRRDGILALVRRLDAVHELLHRVAHTAEKHDPVFADVDKLGAPR